MRRVMPGGALDLVVQYHHRFQDAGRQLAAQAGCPLILRVEAIEVEEQRDWGLRGRRSGRWVVALGERRLFRSADELAVVSAPLATSLERLGVPARQIHIVPNGVDTRVFSPDAPPRVEELARFGLDGRFLIGWVGGFRPYHGLEQLAELLPLLERAIPEATLCLVGTGPLMRDLQQMQERHPRSLALLPPVPHDSVASWLCSFDVCLQLSRADGAQHYSPLKVREYLACGRPVVAPFGTQAPELLDRVTGMMYPAGDMRAALEAIGDLRARPDFSRSLGQAGRAAIEDHGTWGAIAQRVAACAGGGRCGHD